MPKRTAEEKAALGAARNRRAKRIVAIICIFGPTICVTFVASTIEPRSTMAATTTIRLPPKLRARLGALAKQTGRSAHSLIVEAVERHAAYEEQIRSLVKEALAADAEIDATGEVYRAADVHAWMQRLSQDGRAPRPKP